MPENFASILESLAAEGRELARPMTSSSVAALGRSRRRRRGVVTVTSAVAAVAVVAGIVAGAGAHGRSMPPVVLPVAPSSTASSPAVDPSVFLAADDLPNPGTFQWKSDGVFHETVGPAMPGVDFGLCGSQSPVRPPTLHAESGDLTQYLSVAAGAGAVETIFHYSSAAAARSDYAALVPDPAKCTGGTWKGRRTGTVPDGFAWVQSQGTVDAPSTSAEHAMVVLSGTSIAYWRFGEYSGGPAFDDADDQAALQRMADRLHGRTPVPATNTAAPPGLIPDSAWLDPAQIPFATADDSAQGWVPMAKSGLQQGAAPATDLCADETGSIVDGVGSTNMDSMFHGSPKNTPENPKTNYLYSSADEDIHTFQDAAAAATAFAHAKGITALHGCTFMDPNNDGKAAHRTIKVGTVTATGFSVEELDSPTPSHIHLYVVIKGTNVAMLTVYFQKGDDTLTGDAAVLTAMAAHLP